VNESRRISVALALALIWSVGLLLVAVLVPVNGSATLVDQNGQVVLIVAALPMVLTAVASTALAWEDPHGRGSGRVVAWLCVAALIALTLLGILSVGVFVLPVTVLVAYATARTSAPAA
jgi:hypothetical protein